MRFLAALFIGVFALSGCGDTGSYTQQTIGTGSHCAHVLSQQWKYGLDSTTKAALAVDIARKCRQGPASEGVLDAAQNIEEGH